MMIVVRRCLGIFGGWAGGGARQQGHRDMDKVTYVSGANHKRDEQESMQHLLLPTTKWQEADTHRSDTATQPTNRAALPHTAAPSSKTSHTVPHTTPTWGRVRSITASITNSPALPLPAGPWLFAAAPDASATTAPTRGTSTCTRAGSLTEATKLARALSRGLGRSAMGCWLACMGVGVGGGVCGGGGGRGREGAHKTRQRDVKLTDGQRADRQSHRQTEDTYHTSAPLAHHTTSKQFTNQQAVDKPTTDIHATSTQTQPPQLLSPHPVPWC